MIETFLTRAGYEKLRQEIDELKQRKSQLSRDIAEAREKGDLSENAEYHSAKDKLGEVMTRINTLQDKLQGAKLIEEIKVPKDTVSWIEYIWTEAEIAQRYKQVTDRMKITCAWCDGPADPEKDGFSLVQVAFGCSQERYVFCSTACYEAFRKMYPSRVHRNCYETKCSECTLCTKRYDDETDGIRMIAKDFLKIKNLKK